MDGFVLCLFWCYVCKCVKADYDYHDKLECCGRTMIPIKGEVIVSVAKQPVEFTV